MSIEHLNSYSYLISEVDHPDCEGPVWVPVPDDSPVPRVVVDWVGETGVSYFRLEPGGQSQLLDDASQNLAQLEENLAVGLCKHERE